MQTRNSALKTAFFTDERTFWHTAGQFALMLPVGGWVQPPSAAAYAESPDSKRRFLSLVAASGLLKKLDEKSAEPLADETLLLVHDADYLTRLKEVSDNGGGYLDPVKYGGDDTPAGPGTYDIAKIAAGLTTQALEDVLTGKNRNAYSLSRPPGHHATKDRCLGFCYLNNIALAIEVAKKRHNLGKVAIIDWDVHHGNGQQEIFYDRDDVLTISIHQENNYPTDYYWEGGSSDSAIESRGTGKGKGYNMNIPLFPGQGHEAYLYAFEKLIAPAVRKFAPEVIIIACGFDASMVDPLSRMALHSDTYRLLTREAMNLADELCDGKLVVNHEGGYAESYVPFCGLAVVEELSGIDSGVEDPELGSMIAQQPTAEFNEFQKRKIDQYVEFFKSNL